jgi:hypothetical protein
MSTLTQLKPEAVQRKHRERFLPPISEIVGKEHERQQGGMPVKVISWKDLTDTQFIMHVRQIRELEGATDWNSFADKYRGIRYEVFRRGIDRDELGFAKNAASGGDNAPAAVISIKAVGQALATPSWRTMDDTGLIRHVQDVIDREGIADWNTLIVKYRGFSLEMHRRGIQSDEFRFNGTD